MKRLLVTSMLSLACVMMGCGQGQPGEERLQVESVAQACSVVYTSEAVIAGSVDRIWDTIVDLPRYSEWNPWVVKAEGKIEPGAAVTVDVILNGQKMRAEHTVEAVDPKTHFCWRDAGWNALFVSAHRCRTLTPRPDGTVLYQVDLELGRLAGVANALEGTALQSGMNAETAALKTRVENP